jgi:hypothetical protein
MSKITPGGTALQSSSLAIKVRTDTILLDGVYVDASVGVSGTTFPIGTIGTPVDNFADALTILNDRNLPIMYVSRGPDWALSANVDEWFLLAGLGYPWNQVDFNSHCFTAVFQCKNMMVTGDGSDGSSHTMVELWDCWVTNASNIYGYIRNSVCTNTITLDGYIECWNCLFDNCTLDVQGKNVEIFNATGKLTITNLTGVGAGTINIFGNALALTLDASCDAGAINIYGIVKPVVDNSTGTVVTNNAYV